MANFKQDTNNTFLASTKQIEELRGEIESEFENHFRKFEELNEKLTKL